MGRISHCIKIYLVSFLVLIVTDPAIGQTSEKDFLRQMNEAIPQWLDEFNVPGAALALIDDGKIILQKGYGFADLENQIHVNVKTGFNIGSISKTIAAWGVMTLVEKGRLDLDAPINNYLTRWRLPLSDFDVNKVTLRRLLSHTAGLSLHGYPGFTPDDTLPTIEESLSGATNGVGDVRLIMEPGTKCQYSGGGYTIAQLIVEEITKHSFADYVEQAVLVPLGMRHSSYNITQEIKAASAREYDVFGDPVPFELFTAQAAAGLHTTIEDFAKFALANLSSKKERPGRTVLSEATVSLMMEADKACNGTYGLGYAIQILPDNITTLVGHGGANTGWQAYFQVNPQSNDGFVMVTNGGAGWNVYNQAFCKWVTWKTGLDMGDLSKKSVVAALTKTLKEDGIDMAIRRYKSLKKDHPDQYIFNEWQLNSLGYILLSKERMEDAISIFRLNIEEYPDASNPYDSLGEAYMLAGSKKLAIENYRKSIELDPANDNAREMIRKMEMKNQ